MGAAATLDVTTAFGRIPLGRISDDPARPVLLVIRGVLLPADHMGGLVDDLADEADVLLAHLPGMHSPTLVSTDLATMTAAFREVLDTQLAGRRVVLFGMSAGGLVALGLAKAAQVKTLVLLDPFLRVEDCWALRELIVDGAPSCGPGSTPCSENAWLATSAI
ncbi:MAG: hypothetical protein JWP86_1798 [Phenylobacterium sp.]|nr:hypothetical protein [Phenylobacterium sp.]